MIYYAVIYSVFFTLMAFIAFFLFIMYDKSFVWKNDGIVQHFNFLEYYGVYLRGIIKNLFSTGQLVIPMYDFKIAFGNDIITTLNYYVMGDPLNLLSAVVPSKYTEVLYNFLVILRLYFAGFAFSAFAFKFTVKKNKFYVLIGSMAYVFCGFVLFASVRHPYFTNPMIYFPLVLLGMEHIFEKRRPYLFIFSVFISAVSNFYFFYIIVLLTVIYGVFRFFMIYKSHRIKAFFTCLLKNGGSAIFATLAAGVIFIPTITALFLSNRSSSENNLTIFYNLGYYVRFLGSFVASPSAEKWMLTGFTPLAFFSVIAMFLMKKKNTAMKIGFLLLTAFILFPIFGYIFNGFSYICNRWVWGYALLVCMIITLVLPSIIKFTKRQWIILLLSTFVFTILSLLFDTSRTTNIYAGVTLTLLSAAFMFLVYFMSSQSINFTKNMRIAFILILVVSIAANSYYRYSVKGFGYINEFIPNSKANYYLIQSSGSKSIAKLSDNSFYRYDDTVDSIGGYKKNNSLLNNGHSVQGFYSLSNPYVYKFTSELSDKVLLEQSVAGFDSRTIPETLSAVKYAVVPTSEVKKGILPFGFSDTPVKSIKAGDISYGYYKNQYALPLGYTYSSYISRDDYNKLTAIEKQQALMQGVVLEEEVKSVGKNTNLKFIHKEIPFEIKPGNNVELRDGKFIVNSDNSKVEITFEGMENSETYLSFNGIKFSAFSRVEQSKSAGDWNMLSLGEKLVKKTDDLMSSKRGSSLLKVQCGGASKSATLTTPDYPWHSTRTNIDFNCHYSEKAKNKITVTFGAAGEYSYDSMKVICLPMDEYKNNVAELGKNVLENININTNRVTGTINLDESKMLTLAIPYSTGWTACVDGKKVPLYRANTMYMALDLDAGTHTVELEYSTPNINIGILATVTGFAGITATVLVIEIFSRRKRKNNRFTM